MNVPQSDYLAFGGATEADGLDALGALDYLRRQGFGSGDLAQARRAIAERRHTAFAFDSFGVGYCDFCFIELMGGAFDVLQDQRLRCVRCSRTVIRSEEAFRHEFEAVRQNMEMIFGISISVPVMVRMVNAREIARHTGETFTATPAVDPRVLGFLEVKEGRQSLFIENGSPRMAVITTMAHELTHAWQMSAWDMKKIEGRYGSQNALPVVEGMAVWAQIQYLLMTREFSYAERQYAYMIAREDEYGVGFRVFERHYPLSEDRQQGGDSPFQREWPL